MGETEEIQSFKDQFAAARRAVEAACAAKDADWIKSSSEGLMRVAEDETQYYYPQLFAEDFADYRRTMFNVPAALREAGMRAADVIVWSYRVGRPSERMDAGPFFETLLEAPCGEFADPGVWREVAERLQDELKTFTAEQLDEAPSDGAYQLEAIDEAWKRAGCEGRALDLWVEHVPKIKNWKEVAERLNRVGRYDDAIRVAREGVRVCKLEGGYPNDYDGEMMEPLADAFSAKGDHLKAAAILAEQFLDWIGAYEDHRSVESFNRVLQEAELAGVKAETRAAIVHALKTGVNPEPLWDWKIVPPVKECAGRPVPKLVVYRAPDALAETPCWPLPRSNEGLKFRDLRWEAMKHWCQQDQEFLLKLALADGDQQEIIRRFEALPEFPQHNGWPLMDAELALLDAVAAAVRDVRPDLARTIKLRSNGFIFYPT